MLSKIIGSVVGTKNDRELKRMRKVVSKINAHEATIQALSDEQLQQRTEEFKARHQKGESLDALLPEAFAVCRVPVRFEVAGAGEVQDSMVGVFARNCRKDGPDR